MKFEISIPYLFDLKTIKDIKRQKMTKVKIKNNVLRAVVETKDIRKEYGEMLKTKYKYKKQEFTPFVNKIQGINLKPLTKKLRTYEDAVMITGLLVKNLIRKANSADNGFTDFLGSNYLFWNPINSCGAICTMSAGLLRELGIEAHLVRGVMLVNKRKRVYKNDRRVEHCWSVIRVPGKGLVELDFTGQTVYNFPNERYIAMIRVRDPMEYFTRHLGFSTSEDYLSSSWIKRVE